MKVMDVISDDVVQIFKELKCFNYVISYKIIKTPKETRKNNFIVMVKKELMKS